MIITGWWLWQTVKPVRSLSRKWKVKVKSLSRARPSSTPWTAAHQAPPSMGSPGESTGVGCRCRGSLNPGTAEEVPCSLLSWPTLDLPSRDSATCLQLWITDVWTRAGQGRASEEGSADTDARPCVEQTAAGKLLHDTRSSARCSVQT